MAEDSSFVVYSSVPQDGEPQSGERTAGGPAPGGEPSASVGTAYETDISGGSSSEGDPLSASPGVVPGDRPAGGSGMGGDWLYADGADPSVHTPGWVNANLSTALGDGIVVDNSYGPGGRYEGVFANREEHIAHEKMMYSTVDYGEGDAGDVPAVPGEPTSPAATEQ
jgi:hypothetical protein